MSLNDAVLLNQAEQEGCMYFVTRDNNIKKVLDRQELIPKIPEIIKRNDFFKKLDKLSRISDS